MIAAPIRTPGMPAPGCVPAPTWYIPATPATRFGGRKDADCSSVGSSENALPSTAPSSRHEVRRQHPVLDRDRGIEPGEAEGALQIVDERGSQIVGLARPVDAGAQVRDGSRKVSASAPGGAIAGSLRVGACT